MEEKLNYFSLIFTKHKYISAKTKGGSSLQYNSTQYYKKIADQIKRIKIERNNLSYPKT